MPNLAQFIKRTPQQVATTASVSAGLSAQPPHETEADFPPIGTQAPAPPPPGGGTFGVPTAPPFNPAASSKEHSSSSGFNKKVLIIPLIILLVAAGAFGTYYYYTNIYSKAKDKKSTTEQGLEQERNFATISASPSPAPPAEAQELPENIYVNSTLGISFEAPEGWKKVDSPNVLVAYQGPEKEFDINNAEFNANLNLITEELPQEMTLEEYAKQGNNSRALLLGNYQLLDSVKETLADEPAIIDDFFSTIGSVTVRQRQVYAVRGKRAYIFTFTTLPQSWERYVSTFDNVRNSFTFTGTVSGARTRI